MAYVVPESFVLKSLRHQSELPACLLSPLCCHFYGHAVVNLQGNTLKSAYIRLMAYIWKLVLKTQCMGLLTPASLLQMRDVNESDVCLSLYRHPSSWISFSLFVLWLAFKLNQNLTVAVRAFQCEDRNTTLTGGCCARWRGHFCPRRLSGHSVKYVT